MVIDARTREITDTLKQLRELFPTHDNEADPLEVLVRDKKDARKVRAFTTMSGFKTTLYQEDSNYRASISGSSCGCL
ncbi:MAG: hypothetical protein HZA15_16085 [Nitrospirae bacterium]|nr:hypothetical protein [Nitrospirota bacterium]